MNKKVILTIFLAVFALSVMPTEIYAANVEDWGFKGIAERITPIIFGWPTKLIAIFAGAYGILQCLLQATISPLLTFGSISVVTGLVPLFIDKVFNVTSMLLP